MKVTVALLLLLSAHFVSTYVCPNGWHYFHENCYMFVNRGEEWWDAWDACKEYQAHLPMVKNAEVEQWLVAQMDRHAKGTFWLGADLDTMTLNWRWQPSLEKIDYFNWAVGEPSKSSEEHCLEFWTTPKYGWHDCGCHSRNRFACQKPASENNRTQL